MNKTHKMTKKGAFKRKENDFQKFRLEVFGFAISRPLIGQLSPFSISHWLKQQIRTPLAPCQTNN